MTVPSLFDVLARESHPESADGGRAGRLAAKLVEAALADWQRVRQYQVEFGPVDWADVEAALAIEQSIHTMYSDWASDAEAVLARVRQLCSAGHAVIGADALQDALASTRARLRLTPEKAARGVQQAQKGEFTSTRELRDELRGRVRS